MGPLAINRLETRDRDHELAFYVLNFTPHLFLMPYSLFCVRLLVSCALSLCVCPHHPFRPCLFCFSACFRYAVSLICFSLFLPFPLALLFISLPCSPFVLSFSSPSLSLFTFCLPFCLTFAVTYQFHARLQDTSMNYVARPELTSAVLKACSHTAY